MVPEQAKVPDQGKGPDQIRETTVYSGYLEQNDSHRSSPNILSTIST